MDWIQECECGFAQGKDMLAFHWTLQNARCQDISPSGKVKSLCCMVNPCGEHRVLSEI